MSLPKELKDILHRCGDIEDYALPVIEEVIEQFYKRKKKKLKIPIEKI